MLLMYSLYIKETLKLSCSAYTEEPMTVVPHIHLQKSPYRLLSINSYGRSSKDNHTNTHRTATKNTSLYMPKLISCYPCTWYSFYSYCFI